MNILVVGGAGYIGSHMVKLLLEQGHSVVTYDNLSSGYADAVLGGELIVGDLADREYLAEIFRRYSPEAVIHFAGSIQVGESVRLPGKYYRNNLANTLNLLDAMVELGVRHVIFSSTAAIFGTPQYTPIDETHPRDPINPYGASKWMIEQVLADYDRAHGLRSVALRYFNAAGADPDGRLGERHEPETHLIPLVLRVAAGKSPHVQIFGDDYPTRDGTCVRDYIHICDLCDAHLLALEHLQRTDRSAAYNLGNGNGYTVQEVVDAARAITGHSIPAVVASRRAGDPPVLIADSRRAVAELGWKPRHAELPTMVTHAWRWMQSNT